MKELIEKISSYNLFNYLLPGALFAVFVERVTSYRIVHDDIVTALFLYYFIGMVISRIGSLFFEPIAKIIGFAKFADYKKYVEASTKDEQLMTLSEANNTYRTLCSLFLTLGIVKLYELISSKAGISATGTSCILFACLFILFAFAYRKQTNYITQRIGVNNSEPD